MILPFTVAFPEKKKKSFENIYETQECIKLNINDKLGNICSVHTCQNPILQHTNQHLISQNHSENLLKKQTQKSIPKDKYLKIMKAWKV